MPQEQIQKQGKPALRTEPKEPKKYDVTVLNDDFTTFDFVIMVMMTVFMKTYDDACRIAETTHIHGKALVGKYTLDIAKSKVAKATAMARAEGYPLKFDIKAE